MKNIFKIVKISKPLYKLFSLLSVLILATALVQQAAPIMVKFIVDEIEGQLTSKGGNLQRLYLLIGLAFVLTVLSIFLNAINQRIGDYTRACLGKFLTEEFYRKIFTLPQQYFDSEVSGKIVNQLTRGILSITDFMNAASNFILPALFQSLFTIVVLAYYSPPIAFLAAVIFPIYIAISSYSTKRWGKEEVKKNRIEDILRGRIQEVISNMKLVKSFNWQPEEWKFVSKKLENINIIYDKQSKIYHVLNFARNFGLEIVLVGISFIVFSNTFKGIFTLGEMVLILQLINQLRRPLFAMSFILERVQKAESGSKEFFEILDLKSEEKFASSAKPMLFKNPSIEFADVSFNYQDSGSVLRKVSFLLDRKETIALVGHSGAGKTTIVDLILKFYEPTDGEIRICSRSYRELDHRAIRENISLVFQDSELFSSTIAQNVSYGIKRAKKKDIITALKKANAYEFVIKLPSGLDSKVGERGVRLSGGQKQRIQIARAIMQNAPVLILDEATSSLDAKSEKLVQDALEKLFKDRLVIIIAHRFSTIQGVDRILVLDKGRIVDSGKSKELAKKKGIYSELLRYQIAGNQKLLEEYDITI